MRLFFFALASTWGFVIGSAAAIGALATQDALEIHLGPLIALVLAAAVAGAGGVVVAIVYREAVGKKSY
jgi:hypothetical protein